jgi:integrase
VKRASLIPVKVPGRASPWRLNVPEDLSRNGKRTQLFFKTKVEAEREADSLNFQRGRLGGILGRLDTHQLADAVRAFERLEGTGTSLLDAVNAFLAERDKPAQSKTLGEAFDAFQARIGRSLDYDTSVKHTRALVEPLLPSPIVSLTAEDFEMFLKPCAPSTRNLRINRLSTVFRFAIKRGWLTVNPIERLERSREPRSEVSIYIVDDVHSLLRDALANDRPLMPFLVVCAFCGLRPEREAFHLEWSDVHLDDEKPEVIVRPELSKVKRKRAVELSQNAIQWIRASGVHLTGRICPFSEMTLKRKRTANHKRAGVDVVKDGLRHGFCSFHLAMYGDLTRSLLASGHSDPKVFWRNYYRHASSDDSRRFWSLAP